MIDSTIVRAHQHSAGARKKTVPQAIGRSKGGLSTKIHATVDALGNPLGFHLSGGQATDLDGADVMLPALKTEQLLADKGYDADARVIHPWEGAGKRAVIPPAAQARQTMGSCALPSPAPHRELLCQAQAISCHRDPLRQDRPQLPRRHSSGRFCHLVDLTTGPRAGYGQTVWAPVLAPGLLLLPAAAQGLHECGGIEQPVGSALHLLQRGLIDLPLRV